MSAVARKLSESLKKTKIPKDLKQGWHQGEKINYDDDDEIDDNDDDDDDDDDNDDNNNDSNGF